MVKGVKFRRGTTAEHSAFTGAEGEITIDTDKDIAVVHDGTTVGGKELVGVAATQRLTNKDIEATTLSVTGVSTFSNNVNIGGTVSIGTTIDIIPYDSLGTLSFEGSAGQLFSITNNLTSGSIFSVNDVSGIPSIGVDANGTIQFATFGGNVGVGTTNPTSKFTVVGNTLITGNASITGVTTTETLGVTGLSTSLNLNVVGVTTSSTINDSKGDVRSIPQNSQTSSYIIAASDAGKHISITTGGVTINASTLSVGDAVTIFNNSGSSQTITQGSNVTLRQAATTNTGNRTLTAYGICTLLCIVGGANPTIVISGAGVG